MEVEVFKTNVSGADHARMLVEKIHAAFAGCQANFDLEDCDRILRVVSAPGSVSPSAVVELLSAFGFHAEVLSDDIPELLRF